MCHLNSMLWQRKSQSSMICRRSTVCQLLAFSRSLKEKVEIFISPTSVNSPRPLQRTWLRGTGSKSHLHANILGFGVPDAKFAETSTSQVHVTQLVPKVLPSGMESCSDILRDVGPAHESFSKPFSKSFLLF